MSVTETLLDLTTEIDKLPPEYRAPLYAKLSVVLDAYKEFLTRIRKREDKVMVALDAAKTDYEDMRLEIKSLQFDLDATKRERDQRP